MNNLTTNFIKSNMLIKLMGVRTHTKCSCPTALVASNNILELHYDRRVLNKLAIANKAGLSFCGFLNLLSPLHKVTRKKENKMKKLINILELHYDRRVLNKLAIANKADLSFCGFLNLLSPLHKVTRKKENKMKKLINILELHYDRRVLNKLAIANKADLSLYGFLNLLSPIISTNP